MKINKTSDDIIDLMIQKIADGEWKTGDLLPGERLLSEEFKVSRALLREALIALQLLGLIKVRHGGKREVASFSYRPISALMAMSLQNEDHFESDLLHFRALLECEAAHLACAQEHSEKLIQISQEMENIGSNSETEATALDIEFHQELFRLSQNIFLIKTSELIEELLKHSVSFNRTKILVNENYRLLLIRQHQQIALAIQHKDTILAVKIMREHLQTVNTIEEKQ